MILGGCSSNQPESPASRPVSQSVGATSTSTPAPDSATSPTIVAKVGPFHITLEDVLRLSKDREKVAHPIGSVTPVETVRRDIRKDCLDEMIRRRLLVLGALKHPEWVSDASCEQAVQKQLASLGPEEVERRRQLGGVSKDDFLSQFRRFIREELMKREILRHEVDEKAIVTEEDIKARYERDRVKMFYRPDSWAAYHIDLYLPREQADQLPSIREKLERLRTEAARLIESATNPQAKAGIFAPMVQKHSQAPDAKTGYAYIYDTPEVSFDREFVERVKTCTIGELSPVFDLAGDDKKVGVCFFLAFEMKPGVYTEFERARKLIRFDLTKEKRASLHKDLLERLKNEYKVQIWEDRLYQGIETTTGG